MPLRSVRAAGVDPDGPRFTCALASLALQRFAPGRFAAWLACPTALLRIRCWRVWLAGDVQFGRGFGNGLGDLGGVNGAAVVVEESASCLSVRFSIFGLYPAADTMLSTMLCCKAVTVMWYLSAVSARYCQMCSPSAMASSRRHGSNGKLSVKMSLSERTPG